MGAEISSGELLAAWRSGDEHAATILTARFFTRLVALTRSRWSRQLSSRLDPEDIVQSAYRSFFVRTRDGHLSPTDEDDLWPILATITLRKLIRQFRRHSSASRSLFREDHSFETEQLRELISRDPSPLHASQAVEDIEAMFAQLSPATREMAQLTLCGHDAVAIAKRLGCDERTVRRNLQKVRLIAGQSANIDSSVIDAFDLRCVLASSDCHSSQIDLSSRTPTTTLDLYRLQKLIGQGAFSKVYRAIAVSTRAPVAIKFLRKPLWRDHTAAASLRREFDTLIELQHRSIIAVQGWGTTPAGGLFLVLDLLQGQTLSTWCSRCAPDLSELLHSLYDVAEALACAHLHGVLHGDLKPQNVMRTDDGRTILMDFGMSRWFQWVDDIPPRGGTAGFLSPEQISPAFGELTVLTDVYGWGALAYAVLTGRPPMLGNDLSETLANVLNSSSPIHISEATYAIPENWEQTILACLRKEASSRPRSMRDILAALQ